MSFGEITSQNESVYGLVKHSIYSGVLRDEDRVFSHSSLRPETQSAMHGHKKKQENLVCSHL